MYIPGRSTLAQLVLGRKHGTMYGLMLIIERFRVWPLLGEFSIAFSLMGLGSFKVDQEEWTMHPNPLPPRRNDDAVIWLRLVMMETCSWRMITTYICIFSGMTNQRWNGLKFQTWMIECCSLVSPPCYFHSQQKKRNNLRASYAYWLMIGLMMIWRKFGFGLVIVRAIC